MGDMSHLGALEASLPPVTSKGNCLKCGQEGHFRQECMDCSYKQAWMSGTRAWKLSLAKMLLSVQVNGTRVMGLLDSGCSQTIIQTSLVESPNTTRARSTSKCIHRDM